jgi:hypothetical protein
MSMAGMVDMMDMGVFDWWLHQMHCDAVNMVGFSTLADCCVQILDVFKQNVDIVET